MSVKKKCLKNIKEIVIVFFSPNALEDVETHLDDEKNSERVKRLPWRCRRLRFRRLRRIRIRGRKILKKLVCQWITTCAGSYDYHCLKDGKIMKIFVRQILASIKHWPTQGTGTWNVFVFSVTPCGQAFNPPFLGGKLIELAKFCFKNKRFETSWSFFSKPMIVSHCV